MTYAADDEVATSGVLDQNGVDVRRFARVIGLGGLLGGGRDG